MAYASIIPSLIPRSSSDSFWSKNKSLLLYIIIGVVSGALLIFSITYGIIHRIRTTKERKQLQKLTTDDYFPYHPATASQGPEQPYSPVSPTAAFGNTEKMQNHLPVNTVHDVDDDDTAKYDHNPFLAKPLPAKQDSTTGYYGFGNGQPEYTNVPQNPTSPVANNGYYSENPFKH